MAAVVLGPTCGAFVGLLIALALLPFGVSRAEWFMTVGAALGLFVGLMMSAEEEKQPSPHASEHGGEKGHAPIGH